MNYFNEENILTKKMFDLDYLLEFQLDNDIQIIRGEDYNYECWINTCCYSAQLTPLNALVIGVATHKKITAEKEKLMFEYGGLMYDFDKAKDLFEKRKIVGQMNVINAILGVPKIEYVSPLQKVARYSLPITIFKQGDKIKWSFGADSPEHLRNKTFTANVSIVNEKERNYGVYAEYGQDLIPFELAIKSE